MTKLNQFLMDAQHVCDDTIKHLRRQHPLTFEEEDSLRTQFALDALKAFEAYQRAILELIVVVLDKSEALAALPSLRDGKASD